MPHKIYKKVILVILDGFGIASENRGNAISVAEPQTLNYMVAHFPALTLQASGPLVGLPWGEMGNSEVGHLNIGAGRIVAQDLPRITGAIQDHSFFQNAVFLEAIEHAKQHHSQLHLVGMVSNGGVHSLDEHLYALLDMAVEHGINEVFVHVFTDGRDTPQKVALEDIKKLQLRAERIKVSAPIASVTGRFYAMDRGQHWDQTEMTYQALVNGIGADFLSAENCISENYNRGVTDEMIRPTVIMKADPATGSRVPIATIEDNDAVIFFNFRPDRMVQLVQAFVQPELMQIKSKHQSLRNVYIATMTEYYTGLPVHIAFPPPDLRNNLPEVLSKSGLTQFHIAESEKYAHVTSFFNGGVSSKLPGEERLIITSPNNTENYADHPEMSADKLADVLIDKFTHGEINFYVANFANADMVGHTGNLAAGIKAVQCLDKILRRVMDAALLADAALVITADHGNIEQMIDLRSGDINKDHSTNPVPFLLIANEFKSEKPKQKSFISLAADTPAGVISDVAPTILDLLGLPKPPEMTGVNLLGLL
jgi:2,3-bisphosphoglycerate-independent phosphoglycerate mutase